MFFESTPSHDILITADQTYTISFLFKKRLPLRICCVDYQQASSQTITYQNYPFHESWFFKNSMEKITGNEAASFVIECIIKA